MIQPPLVHLVDDDPSFLKAAARLVRLGGYEVRTYGSAEEFLQDRSNDRPGCVLADLHLPGASGLGLQAALQAGEHPLPVVFLTGRGDIPTSVQAMREGAEDFLTKPVRKEALFAALDRALARDARERETRARRRAVQARFDPLTPREREVLGHLVRGCLNKQVAAELGTTERTIKAHRANLMAKLRVGSVAELVSLARESGWF